MNLGKMSFVYSVNPYHGILCVPYWYIFPVIILNFIHAWFAVYYDYLMDKYRKQLDNFDFYSYKKSVNERLLIQTERELSALKLNGEPFPNEIVCIIIGFLPIEHPLSQEYELKQWERNQWIAKVLTVSQFVYAIVRLIINFINFICIIIRYASWHKDNTELSNWRKYCAFIMAMLYLPSMKGRGAMAMFTVEMVP